mmetsp:Transcript_44831/g.116064  ORF Transcript_44831/g.116064 Transcript_44831/m.116064 type:complete len:826 (+) Transcript_44831:60-2537(+)|eukprot:CAMPEP_0195098558 /NCGR_PEP_ID=MMETSP0448-20130528/57738_1 /TAXON_ID=66468 /ORGANISM="Heterocapsa triquestra, Strain CCMP 448" /LENGTH=825 /DNA_ID=CAMNT_0040133281 /DNA_START=43 /DNA_END=2520 /DNA_ORIENTATION=-
MTLWRRKGGGPCCREQPRTTSPERRKDVPVQKHPSDDSELSLALPRVPTKGIEVGTDPESDHPLPTLLSTPKRGGGSQTGHASSKSTFTFPREMSWDESRTNLCSSSLAGTVSNLISKCGKASEVDTSHLHADVSDPDVDGSWANTFASARQPMPVAHNDAARCARVNKLGVPLLSECEHPEIAAVTAMAGKLFNVSKVALTTHDHHHQYVKFLWLRNTFSQKAMKYFPKQSLKIVKRTNTFVRESGLSCSNDAPIHHNRGSAVCNVVLALGQTVVIRDARKDTALGSHPGAITTAYPFYAGAPCLTSDGLVVAVLCLFDDKPRPDFSCEDVQQLEALALIISRQLELLEMKRKNQELTVLRRSLSVRLGSTKCMPPSSGNDVTMVFTDVQGSTILWEAEPEAMHEALQLHDAVLRSLLAKHHGYEITTEGDAFRIVFHCAFTAIAFCLEAQSELLKCNWPQELLLDHNDSMATGCGAWRGLRVRMGVHTGCPAHISGHAMTGRMSYSGPSVSLTKAIEGVAHGGQIVASAACFSRVDGLLAQLDNPQVQDLGEHIVQGIGLAEATPGDTGVAALRLVQLLPAHLAPMYGTPRGKVMGDGSPKRLGERHFPPVRTLHCTSPGFSESPSGPEVTIAFVNTKGVGKLAGARPQLVADALGILRSCLRKVLGSSGGYECQEIEGSFMLAFNNMVQAASFAEALVQAIARLSWPAELCAYSAEFATGLSISFGALSGSYTSRCPHVSTGRADYFGTIVNRAARIAAAAHPGQLLLGGQDPLRNQAGKVPEMSLLRLGTFTLKGVDEPIALHQLQVALFPPLQGCACLAE